MSVWKDSQRNASRMPSLCPAGCGLHTALPMLCPKSLTAMDCTNHSPDAGLGLVSANGKNENSGHVSIALHLPVLPML